MRYRAETMDGQFTFRGTIPDRPPVEEYTSLKGRYLGPCTAQRALRPTPRGATARCATVHAGVHATYGIEGTIVDQPTPRKHQNLDYAGNQGLRATQRHEKQHWVIVLHLDVGEQEILARLHEV